MTTSSDTGAINSDASGSDDASRILETLDDMTKAFENFFDSDDEDDQDARDGDNDEGHPVDTDEGEEEDSDEGGEDDKDDNEDSSEEGSEEDPAKAKALKGADVTDETEVSVKVGDEEKRVSIKDLKRLYGQEQALTKKSMEVAEARKAADRDATEFRAGLKAIKDKVAATWAEYKDLNLYQLATIMTPQGHNVLLQDYNKAKADMEFVEQQLGKLSDREKAREVQITREDVDNCVKALNDPAHKAHVPGWNDELYAKLCKHAVEDLGVDRATMLRTTDPVVLKLLHTSLTALEAARAAQEKAKKADALKKSAQPKAKVTSRVKVLKPGAEDSDAKGAAMTSKMNRLKKTGSLKDAEAVFRDMFD